MAQKTNFWFFNKIPQEVYLANYGQTPQLASPLS